MATSTELPASAAVYKAHDHGESVAVPARAEVYLVDDIDQPELTQHLLFVVIDDAPMTRLMNAVNGSPIPDPPAPGPPYTSTTGLMPQTPTLLSLAANGVTLRSVRVQVECSPTRATCLTGVYPFRHGIANVVNLNDSQAGDLGEFGDPGFEFPTIFHALSAAQVRTAFVGKCHLSADYNQNFNGRDGLGWQIMERIVAPETYKAVVLRNLNQTSGDFIQTAAAGSYYFFAINETSVNQQEELVNGTYNTTELVNRASAWWQGVSNAERAFMWLAFNGTHTPLGAQPPNTKRDFPPADLVSTQEYIDKADEEAAGGSLVSFWEDQQACMEAIDAELGRLLSEIPADVRARLTVVVIGDNGHDTISIPAARQVWGKDFGADWNFAIDNNRLKGTPYHHGSGVEAVWSGPGKFTFQMPRRGTVLDIAIDAPDIAETICNYFGTTLQPCDGKSFLDPIYTATDTDYSTHVRRDQYTESFNPNGDWTDLLAGPDAGQELVQAMWSWFLSGDGFTPLGRFHLIRRRVSGAWQYELYQHYDESYAPVDPYEKTDLYGDSTYDAIATEIERRIEELLASSLGGGDTLRIEDPAGDLFIPTTTGNGIAIERAGDVDLLIPPTTVAPIGMPVEDVSNPLVIPYISTTEASSWTLPIEQPEAGVVAGPLDLNIPLNASDELVIEDPAGDLLIPSTPGSPNTITIEDSGGDLTVELEAVS